MRLFPAYLLIVALLALAGCSAGSRGSAEPQRTESTGSAQNYNSSAGSSAAQPAARTEADQSRSDTSTTANTNTSVGSRISNSPAYQKVSEKQVSAAQADAERAAGVAVERKIIRNAELSIEMDNPADGQRRITGIAEARGGFVVNTDTKRRAGQDQTQPDTTITLSLRVPAEQFAATLEEIRGIGKRVGQEKVTGQDVTEEYFDLEARIKTKKALEAQFLEIMKQARNVSDALEVQSQLADVRTEIERLEGRRRYLENQSSLSTITVTLSSPAVLVATSSAGFFYELKRAFGTGVDIAASITLFLIQAILALLPVALMVFLPLGLLIRYLVRRQRRLRLAHGLVQDEAHVVPQTR